MVRWCFFVVDLLFCAPSIVCGSSIVVFVLVLHYIIAFIFCNHLDEEESWFLCFSFCLLLCCYYKCHVSLSHVAVGLSAVCNRVIS